MAYWVFLAIPAKPPTAGTQTTIARVVGPMTAAQYQSRYGPISNTVNPANGFGTRLQAQQAASKFNSQPANQRQTGGVSAPSDLLNPSGGLPGAKNPLDLLHGFNFGNWILRIGEIVLGAVLIGVGVAKLTGVDNIVSSALKVVK